jgi:hypothetical protein
LAKAFAFGETGDRYRLASARIPPFLDLDFQAKATRSAANETRSQGFVRKMAEANPLWGAPGIHGELLKLGIEISERTISRLMPKRRKPPSQTWKAFWKTI